MRLEAEVGGRGSGSIVLELKPSPNSIRVASKKVVYLWALVVP